MAEGMSSKDFRQAVKDAKAVFVGVRMSTEDITYFKISKQEALFQARNWPKDEPVNSRVTNGTVYID